MLFKLFSGFRIIEFILSYHMLLSKEHVRSCSGKVTYILSAVEMGHILSTGTFGKEYAVSPVPSPCFLESWQTQSIADCTFLDITVCVRSQRQWEEGLMFAAVCFLCTFKEIDHLKIELLSLLTDLKLKRVCFEKCW